MQMQKYFIIFAQAWNSLLNNQISRNRTNWMPSEIWLAPSEPIWVPPKVELATGINQKLACFPKIHEHIMSWKIFF